MGTGEAAMVDLCSVVVLTVFVYDGSVWELLDSLKINNKKDIKGKVS